MVRAVLVALTFLALILVQPWQASAETDALRVSFESDPLFENVNVPINIDNATPEDTVIGEWRRDLDEYMPNGTYYGPLLPPAMFRNDAVPSWWTADETGVTGRFTYVTLSAHFNLSRQKIMSGASEWWIRAPFDPVSIEASAGLIVSVFEGYTDTSAVTIYDGYNNANMTGRLYEAIAMRPTISNVIPDVFVPIIPNGWENWTDTVGTPMTDWHDHSMFRMVNGHLYIRMDAVFHPSTDYIVTFCFRLAPDSNLYTYWSTSERPTGNTSVVKFYEIMIADNGLVSKLDSSEMIFDLDLDISFIFVEGVGYGGMFGKRIEVRQGSRLAVYPFLNISDNGSQYPSFCLPFIANESVEIHPEIYQGSGSSPGDAHHTWYFNPSGGEGSWDLYFFNPSVISSVSLIQTARKGNTTVVVSDASAIYVGLVVMVDDSDSTTTSTRVTGIDGDVITLRDPLRKRYSTSKSATMYLYLDAFYDYTDFMLFSSNRTLNNATFDTDDQWNVEVDFVFNQTMNITLLCYESDRPTVNWSDLAANRWNSSLSPWGRPQFYESLWETGSRGMVAWMSYEVWCSARGTEGQWAVVTTTASGLTSYNYHFPQRIELSSAQWKVVNRTDEVEWEYQELWEQAREAWAEGHYLKALWIGFKAIFKTMWDGGTGVSGAIKDGLSRAWEGMKKWGSIVYSRILEFFGFIYDVISQAFETIADWWDAFKYMIAPMVMILFIGLTSKLGARLFMGRDKKGKGVKA